MELLYEEMVKNFRGESPMTVGDVTKIYVTVSNTTVLSP
jgi:hypothetical protein